MERIGKKIMSVVYATAVCLPVLLILDGGPDAPCGVERFRMTNVVGLAWLGFLILGGFRYLTPKWMRKELDSMFPENEDEE